MPVFSICETSTVVNVSNPPFNVTVRVYSLKVRIITNAQEANTPAFTWGNSTSRNAARRSPRRRAPLRSAAGGSAPA